MPEFNFTKISDIYCTSDTEGQYLVLDTEWGARFTIPVGAPVDPVNPPDPTPPGEETIPMFDPGDVQLFFKDDDCTDRVQSLWAIYHKGIVSFGMVCNTDKLSARVGDLMIVPNKLKGTVNFGGVAPYITGSARLGAAEREWDDIGIASWKLGPDGRYGIVFDVVTGGPGVESKKLARVCGTDTSADIPWNLHYGIIISGSIPVLP